MKKQLLTIFLSTSFFLVSCADEQARSQISSVNMQLSDLQQNVALIGTKMSNEKTIDSLNHLEQLQNQIDQLNGEISTIKHSLETYQQLQNQLIQGLDQRLQLLEQVKAEPAKKSR